MIEVRCAKRLLTSAGPLDLAVDIKTQEGTLLALFGESGSGKTTVLRMIAGLTRPDEGYIAVNGRVLFDSAAGIDVPVRKRRAAMVFQEHNLFPSMTVWENIAYAANGSHGLAFAEELLRAADLTALRSAYPSRLSGGQRQRTALIRAMVNAPDLLLLDEPFSSLDMTMRVRLQDEVAALHRRYGMSMVLVSHDLGEVMRMAQQVVCLGNGRVTAYGTPEDVFVRTRLSSKFKVSGTVLDVQVDGVLLVVTVAVGSEIVRVASDPGEAEGIKPGDVVSLASKAFNPIIIKAEVPA
jgi:molybdate transport system ATP-binding protein